MVAYMRELISEIDEAIAPWLAKRQEIAARLAAMEAATDPAVLEVAADYEERLAEDRPYEDAEDAETLLSEAHKRYVP